MVVPIPRKPLPLQKFFRFSLLKFLLSTAFWSTSPKSKLAKTTRVHHESVCAIFEYQSESRNEGSRGKGKLMTKSEHGDASGATAHRSSALRRSVVAPEKALTVGFFIRWNDETGNRGS